VGRPILVSDKRKFTSNRYFSFADARLIKEHNSDFLSLKEEKRV
jgi:hypothetical protein